MAAMIGRRIWLTCRSPSGKRPEARADITGYRLPHTGGAPISDRKWLNWCLLDIQERLVKKRHGVSLPVISRLLRKNYYSLKANAKQKETKPQPDRDQQFEYIRDQRAEHQARGQPVLIVDTKKKELVGDYKNPGQIWCEASEELNIHEFPYDALGRAVPHSIYDLQYNHRTVYVGQSADTPTFAVNNIAHWCPTGLPERFPNATHVMIEVDGGGSDGDRSRVWKRDLQEKATDALDLIVTVCHYPTGASKWNPIEHRLFNGISEP